jgi:hypothetical protein
MYAASITLARCWISRKMYAIWIENSSAGDFEFRACNRRVRSAPPAPAQHVEPDMPLARGQPERRLNYKASPMGCSIGWLEASRFTSMSIKMRTLAERLWRCGYTICSVS